MKESNLTVGRLGEELARKHLEKKGYRILEQNYRTRYAEIDLVARLRQGFGGQAQDILVFVEVRTKMGERFGSPEDTLNQGKLRKVKRNAAAYVSRVKWNKLYRVDAVCVVLGDDYAVRRLCHYENV